MSFGDASPLLMAMVLLPLGWFYARHIVRKARAEEARLRRERHATPAE